MPLDGVVVLYKAFAMLPHFGYMFIITGQLRLHGSTVLVLLVLTTSAELDPYLYSTYHISPAALYY